MEHLERHGGQREPAARYMERSPFSFEIANELLPDRFKMPSMPQYKATTGPYDHLDSYNV